MAVGEPAEDEGGEPKPRLPFEHIFHKIVMMQVMINNVVN